MSLQVRSVRLGPVSFRARPRTWLVAALAWGIALAGAIAVLFSGSVNMTPEQFWAALAGVGERADMLLLWEFRMPRAVTGLVVGACLGTAGCLFQALSRNALGSPEIIGLTGGAALGAVASVIVFRSFGWGTAVGAIIGCLGAALLTWVLSPRGFGGGNRLILIGLGVASLIQPVTVLLLTRADSDSATSARLWLTGTLNARNWSHAAVGAVLFAVILPFALLISRHLDAAAPGEDLAAGLGVSRRFTQWTATGVGVALTAAAVAVAGPISFIALAGPHVARRLLKGPTAPAGGAAGGGGPGGGEPAGWSAAPGGGDGRSAGRRLSAAAPERTGKEEMTGTAQEFPLKASSVRLGYDRKIVIEDITLEVPEGELTMLIGPNGCGKSTLLKALARVLAPKAGYVYLGGTDIHQLRTTAVARRLGFLPQRQSVPPGIKVLDMVSRGRFAHQRFWSRWSQEDEKAVASALEVTGLTDLQRADVDELSGGQVQRVWLATVLAQDTPLLLLDEPTTFLDIAHQYEVLKLVRGFRDAGRTVVVVVHDLNQATRFATNLVVMKDGAVVASGLPAEVLTAELVESVFGLPVLVVPDPVTGTPMVVPR